jgi:argininosuccinate synthase
MKIVLAYSGGLDTSVALKWLKDHYSAEVIAFCANLGQIEPLDEITQKALSTGASNVYMEDMRDQYLSDFVFPALKASAAYEGRYLLAAPLARPLIARRLVEIAHQEKADAVAHGATGKGNDQVRFYSGIVAHDSGLQIIAPAIEWDLKSRDEEVDYAHRHGIPVAASAFSPYSVDTNIWGTSIECGPLDDLTAPPPENIYMLTRAPESAPAKPAEIAIGFERGVPVTLNGQRLDPVSLVSNLNSLGGEHGVGRIDIIENRLVGIKTRGIYESPAGTILHAAHRELEDLVLDRDTIHYKSGLGQRYAELVYYGLWYSPLRDALDAFVERTQERVTGTVTLRLHKGSLSVMRRESELAMYDIGLSTYDVRDSFDHRAGQGFSYVWSMPLRVAAKTSALFRRGASSD